MQCARRPLQGRLRSNLPALGLVPWLRACSAPAPRTRDPDRSGVPTFSQRDRLSKTLHARRLLKETVTWQDSAESSGKRRAGGASESSSTLKLPLNRTRIPWSCKRRTRKAVIHQASGNRRPRHPQRRLADVPEESPSSELIPSPRKMGGLANEVRNTTAMDN